MSGIAKALAAWFTLVYLIPALIFGILAVLFGMVSIKLLIDSEFGPFAVGAILTAIFAIVSYRLSPYYKRRGSK